MKINEITNFLRYALGGEKPKDDPMRHVGEVASKAYTQLMALLKQNNVDLRTVNSQQFGDMLQQWTEQFMASGDPRNEQPYILAGIKRVSIPGLINNNSIRDYLLQASEARARAKVNVAKQIPGTDQQTTQTRSSVPGLSLVKGFSDPDDEIILRYNGKDFIIDERTGQWVIEQGQAINSKFQSVFYKEAGALAPDNNELMRGFQTYTHIQPTGAQPQSQQSATQQQQGPLAGTGITVVQSSPLVLQYKKQDYALDNRNQWVNIVNGKPVNSALAQYLQAQADKL